MFEQDNQGTFVKFDREAYKRDAMDLYLYGVIKTFENKAGFTSISVKQLMEYSALGRTLVCKIEQSLTNLIEQQLIEVYDAIDFKNNVEINNVKSSDMLYIRVNETESVKEQFIQVFTDEILRFMSIKMKGTKAAIFKQFLYIMKYVNQGNGYRKISFPNIATISEDTGVSDRSVKNYTKVLEEKGFLYSNILIMGNEKVKKIYSRPQYSQDVNDAIAECIANNTKMINTKKGSTQSVKKTNTVQDVKEFKATMKKPELLLGLDKKIIDTFQGYEGELNDQALSKLKIFKEQHGAEVLIKALHIAMDGKIGLKNPTGFMLKRLADGVLKDAEYQIKRSKELSERMDREDASRNVISVDYREFWRKKKEQEGREKETAGMEQNIKALLG